MIHNILRMALALLPLLGAVAACHKRMGAKTPTTSETQAYDAKAPTFFPVRRGTIRQLGEWEGVVHATKQVEVRADRKLKVKRVVAKDFDRVKRGDTLIEVDRTEIQRRIELLEDQAKAQLLDLSSARLTARTKSTILARRKALVEKGIIAEKEYEDALHDVAIDGNGRRIKRLELARTKRDLDDARGQLKLSNVYAPIDGIVSGLPNLEPGNEEVAAATPLGTVADPNAFSLFISLPDSEQLLVKLGMSAEVELDAGSQKLTGRIGYVSAAPEQSNAPIRTYRVRIDLGARGAKLVDGLRGKARVEFARADAALVMPVAALRERNGTTQTAVAASPGGPVKITHVAIGIRTKDEVEVTSGLSEGQYVAVDP